MYYKIHLLTSQKLLTINAKIVASSIPVLFVIELTFIHNSFLSLGIYSPYTTK